MQISIANIQIYTVNSRFSELPEAEKCELEKLAQYKSTKNRERSQKIAGSASTGIVASTSVSISVDLNRL